MTRPANTQTDTYSPPKGRSTMSTEEQGNTSSTEQQQPAPQFAVKVTLSGPGVPPEGVNRVRYVGPYPHEGQAAEAARTFGRIADDTGRSDEVQIEVVSYEPRRVAHLDPRPPKAIDALAEQIAANPVRGPWVFPDLHDRLVAAHGRNAAEWSWRHALMFIACQSGDRKPEGDALFAASHAAVMAASLRRVEPFTPTILDDAARLLADLVDAAGTYGVDREIAVGQLAPFALDGIVARIPVAA